MQNLLIRLLALTLLLPATPALAKEYTLPQLLALPAAPHGVVIEIVTGDATGLSWALPRAQDAVQQLRQRFANVPVAIVTHGREQFALTAKNATKFKNEHARVRELQREDVQLHVCGTYAGWNKVSPEDFPEYVDVAAAGPAQINDYIKLGYLLLVIDAR